MANLDAYTADALVSAAEIAEAMEMGLSTVWLFAKRHTLPRYRTSERGRTTLFLWSDVIAAYRRPMPAEKPQGADHTSSPSG